MSTGVRIYAWLGALLLSGAFAVAGCGSDDGPSGTNNIISGNNGTDAGNDSNSGGADAGQQDVEQLSDGDNGPDRIDGASGDAGETQKGAFCEAIDLGTIAPNQSASTRADFGEAQNQVQLSCTRGVAKELIFKFSTELTSRVSIRPTSTLLSGWNLQVNHGACGTTEELACFNSGTQNIIAEAGKEYYLVLESNIGEARGEVELAIETEALECFPARSSVCDGDDVQYCGVDFEIVTHTCSLGCAENSCAGDVCDNAIPMDPSGTMRLEGSLAGYTSQFNMRNRSECFDSGQPLPTEGPDILVALNGLTVGQTVRVDTSPGAGDDNDNAVFIVQDCGRTPTCIAGADRADEKYEWVVTEDGDYTLIIDLISMTSPDFVYEITIE